jgi:hypothetical protein
LMWPRFWNFRILNGDLWAFAYNRFLHGNKFELLNVQLIWEQMLSISRDWREISYFFRKKSECSIDIIYLKRSSRWRHRRCLLPEIRWSECWCSFNPKRYVISIILSAGWREIFGTKMLYIEYLNEVKKRNKLIICAKYQVL